MKGNYLQDSSTATATETVMPTMGLLPAPRKPIISTWAGISLNYDGAFNSMCGNVVNIGNLLEIETIVCYAFASSIDMEEAD